MQRVERSEVRRTLTATLALVCLVLQPLLVLLHLTASEHTTASVWRHHDHSRAVHVHGRDSLAHDHELPRGAEAGDEHRPHPVEDHLQALAKWDVVPTVGLICIAPPPAGLVLESVVPPSHALADAPDRGPRSPPPRTAAAPRAPPSVS